MNEAIRTGAVWTLLSRQSIRQDGGMWSMQAGLKQEMLIAPISMSEIVGDPNACRTIECLGHGQALDKLIPAVAMWRCISEEKDPEYLRLLAAGSSHHRLPQLL